MSGRLDITRLASAADDFAERFRQLGHTQVETAVEIEQAVRDIIEGVRSRGDAALVEYTNRFDRRRVNTAAELELAPAALAHALDGLDAETRDALETAAARVRGYHEHQSQPSWSYTEDDGSVLGQKVTPLDSVGLYVPGGKAAYPSSVLMNALPAQVAGVASIVMTVPAPDGVLNPLVLAAAAVAGVDRVFTIGGAQAVAALAWGTGSVPTVDKIVGPGNIWVATAKRQVFGRVGIDMVAGPSEILVISDGSVDADWLAMDLFSQAEHDEDARSILVSPDAAHLDEVLAAMQRLLPGMERAAIIRASLERNGALIHCTDIAEAIELSNEIAPEHLELALVDAAAWVESVRHAGAVFVGAHTPEALGDYCAGPNHVLPTARTARFSSPLGVYDFEKRSSIIHCSPAGAAALAPVASRLARGEGLTAHARSAELRAQGRG